MSFPKIFILESRVIVSQYLYTNNIIFGLSCRW